MAHVAAADFDALEAAELEGGGADVGQVRQALAEHVQVAEHCRRAKAPGVVRHRCYAADLHSPDNMCYR